MNTTQCVISLWYPVKASKAPSMMTVLPGAFEICNISNYHISHELSMRADGSFSGLIVKYWRVQAKIRFCKRERKWLFFI